MIIGDLVRNMRQEVPERRWDAYFGVKSQLTPHRAYRDKLKDAYEGENGTFIAEIPSRSNPQVAARSYIG